MAGVVLPVSDTAQPPETHLKETQRGKKKNQKPRDKQNGHKAPLRKHWLRTNWRLGNKAD